MALCSKELRSVVFNHVCGDIPTRLNAVLWIWITEVAKEHLVLRA